MTISCVDFCRALADDTRQRILEMLQGGEEMCVGDIVEVFNVSQPTISHHLSILRGLGLLNSRKEGKQVFYSLNEENMTECCGMLMIKLVPDPDRVVEFLSETG